MQSTLADSVAVCIEELGDVRGGLVFGRGTGEVGEDVFEEGGVVAAAGFYD